jgi:uncharacterized DUF497 family protein
MNFEWDEDKRLANRAKHGFDFIDAPAVFAYPGLRARDDREDYGEDRWQWIAAVGSRTVVVVYTERDEHTVRIISFRKASRAERRALDAFLAQRPGAG